MRSRAHIEATYEDLLKAPQGKVAELIHGVLHTHPRPRSTHGSASNALSGMLYYPFRKGRGGPGGWILVDEPECHFGENVLVPDMAGWRRERMPELPDAPFFELAPSWVLEVLSPSTEAVDRSEKMPIYAMHGVAHAWLIDPAEKLLEVYRLDGTTYRVVATHAGDAKVRAEPFDAIELELADLWAR
jgi:Uma2 family endonuclease